MSDAILIVTATLAGAVTLCICLVPRGFIAARARKVERAVSVQRKARRWRK